MENAPDATRYSNEISALVKQISGYVKGKEEVIINSLCALFSKGHLLIEDVPGVGKTTLAGSLALSTGLEFKRIQFTSDLLPSDILGVSIFDQKTREFVFKPGPIFANVVLADEINRSTPKTQSALLEAMNEANVTIDGVRYNLDRPFMVIATQNPFEHQGTFMLPESQIDRFSMRLEMGYPGIENEKEILKNSRSDHSFENIDPVISKEQILGIQNDVENVYIENSVLDYLLSIVDATRNKKLFKTGVSPRAAITLKKLSQARALINGRNFCIPEDIKSMVIPALMHRVVLNGNNIYTENSNENKSDAFESLLADLKVPV